MQKRTLITNTRVLSNLAVILIGITVYFLFYHIDFVMDKGAAVVNVLQPFIGGFAIAYLLSAPVRFFETNLFQDYKWRKGMSITLVYILAVCVMAVLLQLVLPQVLDSILQIGNNLQTYLNNFNSLVNHLNEYVDLPEEILSRLTMGYNELVAYVATLISTSLPQILNVGISLGSGLVSGLITVLTAVIASVYMLLSKENLIRQSKKVLFAFCKKESVHKFLEVCHRANRIFGGFIVGKLLDSAIIGVICFVLTALLKIPFPVLMSVVVGATNVIPFFGPFIGAIPCLMILVIVDPWSALRFGILIIALQQFDGNILGPKILGDSTGLAAIWVLISIVVGGGLFGFPGMLLGVPTFGVIYMIIRDVVTARLSARGIDEQGNPLE